MRILFVVDSLFSGGAGRVVSELASRLAAENSVKICVFSCNSKNYNVNENIEIIDGSQCSSCLGVTFLGRVCFLRSTINKTNPSVIISFLTELNLVSLISASFLRVKVIVSERNAPQYAQFSMKLLRNLLYPYAGKVVFQTRAMMDYFNIFIRRRSCVIPNPINPELPTVYNGIRDNRIVMVGRLTFQKNYFMAIDAFINIAEQIPSFILEIYGDGELYNDLEKYISRKGFSQKILLKGHVSDIYNKIKTSSLFIMTSTYEGMPNALMEAMALGIPSISTDHAGGGARSLIINGVNGLLVPVNDRNSLEVAIMQVLKEPDFSKKIAANCQKIRQDYDIDSIIERWIKVIYN